MNAISGLSPFEGKTWDQINYNMIPTPAIMLRTFWHSCRLQAEAHKVNRDMTVSDAVCRAEEIVKQENEQNYLMPSNTHWWHY